MGIGIIVCGLNGSGKSTLGKALSDNVEEWVQSINCKIIRIDGTKPIDENNRFIIEQIQR